MTSRIFAATFALLLLPAAAAAQPAQAEAEAEANAELAIFAPALAETVPVQYVFLGYAPEELDAAAFLAQLPAQARPVVRSRLWYNVNEEVGLHYGYDHRVSFAPADYQDAFFAALAALARPAPPTEYQQLYNAQERNLLEVVDNHLIDAPAVEKWLIDHPPPGVDTRRNTIFFINWHGRPDFRFHVYTKTGEVEPDTGHDFGAARQTRKIIAWGGTTADDGETGLGARGEHRIWFYDLSAGPEAWTDNWNVDSPDLDGDGEVEYRMPPSWEYGLAGGFRPRSALAADLGKVARYVGINLLFTPSPLYPPALTPLRLPATVNLDSNTFEGWPGVDASVQYQKPARFLGAIRDLHRLPFQQDQQDLAYEGQGRECHQLWLADVRCFPARPYPALSNLFLHTALNRSLLIDGGGEYEAILVNYATADGTSGSARLRRRQRRRRHPELRLQLRLAGDRRSGLRPDQHPDPRVRASPGHEPPSRRLRQRDRRRVQRRGGVLLCQLGRRGQLDHELHRPQLGLQPVRPGQPEPLPGRRLPDQRPGHREGDPRPPGAPAGRPQPRRRRPAVQARPAGPAGPRLRRHLRQRPPGVRFGRGPPPRSSASRWCPVRTAGWCCPR